MCYTAKTLEPLKQAIANDELLAVLVVKDMAGPAPSAVAIKPQSGRASSHVMLGLSGVSV